MTAKDVPVEPADIKQRRLDAQKVLYKTDANGNVLFSKKPDLYLNWKNNVEALANAKDDYAIASLTVDPRAWPVVSLRYLTAVNEKRNDMIAEGAGQVEGALDTIASIGVPVEVHAINEAKLLSDVWNLGLTGIVPAASTYSLILPTNWCDPDDHDGWQKLTVDRSSYQHFDTASSQSDTVSNWKSHSESSGGGGVITVGFLAFGGDGAS